MWINLYLPLVASGVFALAAPWTGQRLPPRIAAWLLTSAALVAVCAWLAVLGMLGFTLVGQIPQVAAEGRWSARMLAADAPVDRPVAAACSLVLLACAVALTVSAWRQTRVLLSAWRECRGLPAAGDLVVIDDPAPTAFALPGVPGRVVISSGMLRALSVDERRALLAHERAHLRHRHHIFLFLLQLSAAGNPLLRPVARAGAFALERWADEQAGAEVADRQLIARAVARAALAARRSPTTMLAATGGPVPQRVTALLSPPAPLRRALLVGFGALMVVCCASLGVAAQGMDQLFDAATPSTALIDVCDH
ncbi:M56 family metallopeptidase [Streptomyces sp. H10-C2]|uniref:M56 family metallopeptidase n=1 Tax=unclassified Streptomyces TaxID=2593676 RepID=UPI0024BB4DFE|nr:MULTISPECIES: M56 family metallopeptidase [unclassified Streptomyces]MDJ0343929.1 M56 family metallopeptidase [Streptomyces sp. PH10-H1]MDJ0373370.1 M56 family metallopeptidase [Streptomyces sp. H10-C2]